MEKQQIIEVITFFKDRPYEVITAKQGFVVVILQQNL
jgi:hypothetical protein